MTKWEIRLPTVLESNAAVRIGEQRGPKWLADRAVLRVRCRDCNFRVVAVVAYVLCADRGPDLYPLVVEYQRSDQRWLFADRPKPKDYRGVAFGWLDRTPWVYGRCRSFEHTIPSGEMLSRLPRPNRPCESAEVQHVADADGESHLVPRADM